MAKIFGFEIKFPWQKDEVIVNDAPTPVKATPTQISSTVRSKQLVYNTSGRSTDFQEPDYNLTDVAAAVDTETYFRIAVDKFVSEVWKNGWSFVGKDTAATAYVKRRFHQIAMVSDQPTSDLFEDISRQLITYGNAFVEKRRSDNASGGRRWRTFDGREKIPIAGLFVLDATSMYIARADNGRPLRYQQRIPGTPRRDPEWPADSICHVHYSRQRGLAFGTPFVVPVLDDIRALRNMEQNIEILVFQHAIPLYHYIIGTDELPVQDGEIEALESKLEEMPKHGVLITSHRHAVEAIGAEGEAIDASPYLDYFKSRVLSGLRLGNVVVGEGNTANRSTASTINAIVQDVAQTFQRRIKIFIDLIITEILSEGGFDWDVALYDNLVELFIPEIDLEKKISKENHILEQWQGSAITTEEMRRAIGRDPYTDEQWADTYWERIGLPKALIQALDEKYVRQGSNEGTTTTSSTTKKSTTNKNKPTNQHGSRSSPKLNRDSTVEDTIGPTVTDEHAFLLDRIGYREYHIRAKVVYSDLKNDLAARIGSSTMKKMLAPTIGLATNSMLSLTDVFVSHAIKEGATDAGYNGPIENLGIQMLKDQFRGDIVRLMNDVQSEAQKETDKENSALTLISKMEAMEYRVDFIVRTQVTGAYNQAFAKASILLNNNKIRVTKNCKDNDGCGVGKETVDLSELDAIDRLPPYHPNCTCVIQREP